MNTIESARAARHETYPASTFAPGGMLAGHWGPCRVIGCAAAATVLVPAGPEAVRPVCARCAAELTAAGPIPDPVPARARAWRAGTVGVLLGLIYLAAIVGGIAAAWS